MSKRTDAKPEELCRAYLLTKLVNELGYESDKIEIEHEYTASRPHTITSRIDIIVRDANGDAFLFIEVKNQEEYATIDKDSVIEEQLFKRTITEKLPEVLQPNPGTSQKTGAGRILLKRHG